MNQYQIEAFDESGIVATYEVEAPEYDIALQIAFTNLMTYLVNAGVRATSISFEVEGTSRRGVFTEIEGARVEFGDETIWLNAV